MSHFVVNQLYLYEWTEFLVGVGLEKKRTYSRYTEIDGNAIMPR